ncbi:uncharacterized protein L969DRAFT_46002 [Mixia osmundae IAM 14324]|uniref:Uncharacterized protein n=1 Tax=Mixia osmundae (strain CBS 9802 / IAM 14324 / JCM 22182 / KY 12970) TaxID=764103 RepID=G7DU38_MIXOS|nr:uncharacterized protein L969DRAFT_46002 [Mixia osmundae IAM 14324]KEI40965.1 hypothetical protein L969DRAFT_46002 [Mixia osmundae IAM 14324]GAA94098.1 hypothetical protein E5Q_00745 [Mixia osmundae IAM 14324]
MSSGTYNPTHVQAVEYGPGSISKLSGLVKQVYATVYPGSSDSPKVLVLTGNSLKTKTPVIGKIEEQLKQEGLYGATFSSIGQHAPIAGIREAVKLVKDQKINVIVGVGGGSPIDAGKAIAHFSAEELGGPVMPQVAVPTTLSAAECTQNAGFSSEKGDKTGVAGPLLVPRALIYDAELTKYTPERLWLSTGIRALDHAVECQYRPQAQVPVKQIALFAINTLFTQLLASKADPDNLEARTALQIAAFQSLWPNALRTPLGPSHGLGHKLGATYSIPHGICSCLTLAACVRVLAHTLQPADKACLANIVQFLPAEFQPTQSASFYSPLSGRTSSEELTTKATQVADAIDSLLAKLGLTVRLSGFKVPEQDRAKMAEAVGTAVKDFEGMPTSDQFTRMLDTIA